MCQYSVPAIRAGASVLFATHGRHATICYATTTDTLDHSHVLQTHSPAGAARRRHSTLGPLTNARSFTQMCIAVRPGTKPQVSALTLAQVCYSSACAGLAELADAPDSKSGDRKVV